MTLPEKFNPQSQTNLSDCHCLLFLLNPNMFSAQHLEILNDNALDSKPEFTVCSNQYSLFFFYLEAPL